MRHGHDLLAAVGPVGRGGCVRATPGAAGRVDLERVSFDSFGLRAVKGGPDRRRSDRSRQDRLQAAWRATAWPVSASAIRAIQSGITRQQEDGIIMGTDDKARNKAEELKGKAKEGLGRATDDEELEAEGRTDQAESDLKQAGEKVKDAFKR